MNTDTATVTTQADVETCRIGTTTSPPKAIETKPRSNKNAWILLAAIVTSFVTGAVATMVLVLPRDKSSSPMTTSMEDSTTTDTNPTTSQGDTTTTTTTDPNSPPYWNIRYKYVDDDEDNEIVKTQCILDPDDPHCILSHEAAYEGTTQSYSDGDVFCNIQVVQDGYALKMDLFDTGKYIADMQNIHEGFRLMLLLTHILSFCFCFFPVLYQDKLELHGLVYSGKGLRFDGYPVEANDKIFWNSDPGAETQSEYADHVRAGWRICLVPDEAN